MLREWQQTRAPAWLLGLAPVLVAVALASLFLAFNPIAGLREVAPVEAVAFERTVLTEDGVELQVRNDGPDPVTIAQVLVNDAYRDHTIDDRTLGRLQTARISLPYPWETGLPITIALVTSTGVTAEHHIEAAALTPTPQPRTLGVYALTGVYVGVIPVAIGLLWLPALRRVRAGWLTFFLAISVGLLAFLLVDTLVEGLGFATATAAVLDGVLLFAMSVLIAVTGLAALGHRVRQRGGGGGLTGLGWRIW